MVLFRNFECTINVGNGPLTEYTDPNDAGDRAGAVPAAIASRPAAPLRMLMIRPTAPSMVSATPSATRDSTTYPFDHNHLMRGQTATLPWKATPRGSSGRDNVSHGSYSWDERQLSARACRACERFPASQTHTPGDGGRGVRLHVVWFVSPVFYHCWRVF
jgi:hypothetical protein